MALPPELERMLKQEREKIQREEAPRLKLKFKSPRQILKREKAVLKTERDIRKFRQEERLEPYKIKREAELQKKELYEQKHPVMTKRFQQLSRYYKQTLSSLSRYKKPKVITNLSNQIATMQRQAALANAREARLARINQQKRFQQLSQAAQSRNRYAIALEGERQHWERVNENREASNPINTARQRNQIRQLEIARKRENTRKFSLMQAHKNMLTASEIAIDFTSTQNNILSPNPDNNIMREKPDSISILKKRRNILDTKSAGNDLKFF